MKRIVALLLSLMLVLAAVSAMADVTIPSSASEIEGVPEKPAMPGISVKRFNDGYDDFLRVTVDGVANDMVARWKGGAVTEPVELDENGVGIVPLAGKKVHIGYGTWRSTWGHETAIVDYWKPLDYTYDTKAYTEHTDNPGGGGQTVYHWPYEVAYQPGVTVTFADGTVKTFSVDDLWVWEGDFERLPDESFVYLPDPTAEVKVEWGHKELWEYHYTEGFGTWEDNAFQLNSEDGAMGQADTHGNYNYIGKWFNGTSFFQEGADGAWIDWNWIELSGKGRVWYMNSIGENYSSGDYARIYAKYNYKGNLFEYQVEYRDGEGEIYAITYAPNGSVKKATYTKKDADGNVVRTAELGTKQRWYEGGTNVYKNIVNDLKPVSSFKSPR